MAGVTITFRPEGFEEVLDNLGEAAARTENARGLYDSIGAALAASAQRRFEEEADPAGNPWPPSLRALVMGGRTLTRTGALVASITHEANDDSAAVGTDLIYAAIHQFGGTIKAKSPRGLRWRAPGGGWVRKDEVEMPRRAFLGLDDGDESAIRSLVADWILGVDGGSE